MNDVYFQNDSASTTLVFLHGWCLDPDFFSEQKKFFQSEFEILIPDYTSLIINNANNKLNFLAFILEALKNKINYFAKGNHIILIGHSMGGLLALMLSQRLQKIKGCVVMDTTLPVSDEKCRFFESIMHSLKVSEHLRDEFITKRMLNLTLDNLVEFNAMKSVILDNCEKAPDQFIQLLYEATWQAMDQKLLQISPPLLYVAAEPAAGDLVAIKNINSTIAIQKIYSGHLAIRYQFEALNRLLSVFFNKINSCT